MTATPCGFFCKRAATAAAAAAAAALALTTAQQQYCSSCRSVDLAKDETKEEVVVRAKKARLRLLSVK